MPVRKVTVEDFVPFHDDCEANQAEVVFSSTEGTISAAVLEDGEMFGVSLKKLSKTEMELECACAQEEGVCSHAAQTFYAYLRHLKVTPAAAPLPVQPPAAAAPPAKQPARKAAASAPASPQRPARSFSFTDATREESWLKMGIYGPSGSGKTMSALRTATGIIEREGGFIAVIDTEYGSASKYADRFKFKQLSLPHDAPPEDTILAMAAAEDAGAKVLIIDSASHEWEAIKDFVSDISKRTQYRNNSFAAWKEGTPKQQAFIMAILAFPGHVICTMRSKTEWLVEKDSNGKTRPVRVGLAPQQGKGIEYEFDVLMFLSTEHVAEIEKDRTGKFQDQVITKPSETFGHQMSEWLRPSAAVDQPVQEEEEIAQEVE